MPFTWWMDHDSYCIHAMERSVAYLYSLTSEWNWNDSERHWGNSIHSVMLKSLSIYWQEWLWNSQKRDWYWAPRVTNWIQRLSLGERDRAVAKPLVVSVMKHLYRRAKHSHRTCVRAKSRVGERFHGSISRRRRAPQCPWRGYKLFSACRWLAR